MNVKNHLYASLRPYYTSKTANIRKRWYYAPCHCLFWCV